MALHAYLIPLDEAFCSIADPVIARGAGAYMKNISDFYGIKAPDRRQVLSIFLKQSGLPETVDLKDVIMSAWSHPMREMQYAAMEILFKTRKKSNPDWINLYEYMIVNKSWWDTIDYISPHCLNYHFKHFPEVLKPTINRWMDSENIWLQRSCLLFQLKSKEQTDEKLLFTLINQLSYHKEFFIRKAIGWALREYAKTRPNAVISFVETHSLSGLSKREALKHYTV
jgi:3-methyladenine DNA glycosylase AlkD